MQRRVVISKGKRFLVNAPSWGDGVGPGASIGTLWMSEGSASWFAVSVTGHGSASLQVSASAFPNYTDNSLGYQLLAANDGRSYFIYLRGTPPSLQVSQSAYTGSASPKPNLLLQSTTDSNFYPVYLQNNAGVISLVVSPNYISSSLIYQSGIY